MDSCSNRREFCAHINVSKTVTAPPDVTLINNGTGRGEPAQRLNHAQEHDLKLKRPCCNGRATAKDAAILQGSTMENDAFHITDSCTHLVQRHHRGCDRVSHRGVLHYVASLRKHDGTGHHTTAIHMQTIVHE